jgi:hypothetical protein
VCRRFDSDPGHERKYGRDKELENGGHHGMVADCVLSPGFRPNLKKVSWLRYGVLGVAGSIP